jgi:hypothetical protein
MYDQIKNKISHITNKELKKSMGYFHLLGQLCKYHHAIIQDNKK